MKNPMRETRVIVDLDKLKHNLTILSNRVPGSNLAPAVKSDAYGHGAEAVAKICQKYGVPLLLVATVEEFLILKKNGIILPVLILEDLFPEEMETALHEGAILSTGSLKYTEKVSRTAIKLGIKAKVHVNLDTGMGRMGLFTSNPVEAVQKIVSMDGILMEGIFSHFPCSDETDKEFSYEQVKTTQQIVDTLEKRGIKPIMRHIANSGALIDFPEKINWGLVRPGISIYGMYPSPDVNQNIGLKPVMRLVSRLVKITRYDKNWTIGYGRQYSVKAGSLIGIVPIGYGDGYPRQFSNCGHVLVGGIRIPIAGRVSMDMIAVDLTQINQALTIGEEVVLIGKQGEQEITVSELAKLANTITYEITCNLSPRIPRLYIENGKPIAQKSLLNGYIKL